MLNLIINSYRGDEAHLRISVKSIQLTSRAKALASFGGLPNAIKSKGIVLDLTQRNNSHIADRLTYNDTMQLAKLKDQITRLTWVVRHLVSDAKPVMPNWLSNSEQDKWEPLFKIAMVVGEGWLEKVTQAATLLSTVQDLHPDGLIRGLLLSDMHEIVNARKSEQIGTLTLINRLCEKNAELWGAYDRGAKISAIQIADLMRPFDLKSRLSS